VRIIRTLRESGITSVAVHHAVDARSRFVRDADGSVELFGATPVAAYLDAAAVAAACERTLAQAVHPGYGFLSENADFAQAVAAAGVTVPARAGRRPCRRTRRRRRAPACRSRSARTRSRRVPTAYTDRTGGVAHLEATLGDWQDRLTRRGLAMLTAAAALAAYLNR
jgi:biotin carboxylase